jgi:hypothetical protein
MLTNYHKSRVKTAREDLAGAAANRLPMNTLRLDFGNLVGACQWA